ncbi:hypothetical protein [Bremerella sp.]|uniref:hypothetical protein n=1 Tax=Bremerella sp. TaxID=2795602 RepID=UPI00391D0951
MHGGVRVGFLGLGLLLSLVNWQTTRAQDAPLTLEQKAEALLQLHTPRLSGHLIFPENEVYQSVWLRQRIGSVLRDKSHYGYSREQILRVKKFLCVDSEGTRGLHLYQSVAKWQAENDYVDDAQQTLREAVEFSRRLKQNPPPKARIAGGCASVAMMSPESRIVHEMVRVGSSDEDVLNAAAQIIPAWDTPQYMEEPYIQLAAQLGRHDLAMELTRRMTHSMQAVIHCERVAEEILHSGDHAMAKLAFMQILDRIPDPKQENWNRVEESFPIRAAVCLGHMGEYDLAAKFIERTKEFPQGRFTSQNLQRRAEEYLAQAAQGKSKLPRIAKHDPEYQKKVDSAVYECMSRIPSELREVRIDIMETIPPDDPARFRVLFNILGDWAGDNQDLPKRPEPWVKELLRQQMKLLPRYPAGDKEVQIEWMQVSRQMAAYLIRCDMLEPYRDHFTPKTIDWVVYGLDQYKRLDYPAFSLDESIAHFQSRKRRDSLTRRLSWWLQNAQNLTDAKRMASLLAESKDPVRDPTIYFVAGEHLLSRQMIGLQIDSTNYSVAGEKSEKEWYPLTDLMIDTYLRGEDELSMVAATKIIERLWLIRDQQLNTAHADRRYNEVAAAMLILDELRPQRGSG